MYANLMVYVLSGSYKNYLKVLVKGCIDSVRA